MSIVYLHFMGRYFLNFKIYGTFTFCTSFCTIISKFEEYRYKTNMEVHVEGSKPLSQTSLVKTISYDYKRIQRAYIVEYN